MNKYDKSNDDPFLFAHDTDLSFIVYFHNEIKRLLTNEIVYINKELQNPETPTSQRQQLLNTKNIYTHTIEPSVATAIFLMMYSHLEEWLFNIKEFYASNIELDRQKGSLKRFSPVFKEGLQIDLGSCAAWSNITKTEAIRNCLLHANGRVDLISEEDKRTKIKKIIDKSGKALALQEKRLVLTGDYLLEFQKNIEELVNLIKNRTP